MKPAASKPVVARKPRAVKAVAADATPVKTTAPVVEAAAAPAPKPAAPAAATKPAPKPVAAVAEAAPKAAPVTQAAPKVVAATEAPKAAAATETPKAAAATVAPKVAAAATEAIKPAAPAAQTAPKPVEASKEAVKVTPAKVAAPAKIPAETPVAKKVIPMTAMPTTPFKGYDDFAAFSKANLDAFIQANQVFAKGIEEMSKEVMSLTQANMETAAAAAKAVFTAKTFKDVVDLNTGYSKASFDKFVANSTKLSEMGVKIATDAMAPVTARVNVAVEKMLKPAAQ